jgi:hypothetical protein
MRRYPRRSRSDVRPSDADGATVGDSGPQSRRPGRWDEAERQGSGSQSQFPVAVAALGPTRQPLLFGSATAFRTREQVRSFSRQPDPSLRRHLVPPTHELGGSIGGKRRHRASLCAARRTPTQKASPVSRERRRLGESSIHKKHGLRRGASAGPSHAWGSRKILGWDPHVGSVPPLSMNHPGVALAGLRGQPTRCRMITGICRVVRASYSAKPGYSCFWRDHSLSLSSPSATWAFTSKVSLPTSTLALGLASRL